jgi:hypothetical protein
MYLYVYTCLYSIPLYARLLRHTNMLVTICRHMKWHSTSCINIGLSDYLYMCMHLRMSTFVCMYTSTYTWAMYAQTYKCTKQYISWFVCIWLYVMIAHICTCRCYNGYATHLYIHIKHVAMQWYKNYNILYYILYSFIYNVFQDIILATRTLLWNYDM